MGTMFEIQVEIEVTGLDGAGFLLQVFGSLTGWEL